MKKRVWRTAILKQNLDVKEFGLSDPQGLSEPKFRTEFPLFLGGKWPEFRRKRNLHEPLLTAMAPILPSLKNCPPLNAAP